MNLNKKEFNTVFKKYVVEGIKSGSDTLKEDATDAETFKYALNRFAGEYNNDFTKRRYPNLHKRFVEYLMGCPFDFSIYYNDILDDYKELLVSSGLKKDGFTLTEKEEDYLIDKYYYNIAKVILKQNKDIDLY